MNAYFLATALTNNAGWTMTDTPGLDQNTRLKAAALIKAIADSDGDFEAWRADALADLLASMPLQKSSVNLSASSPGKSLSGAAATGGQASIEEPDKQKSWSWGEREFRCGAYVVTRYGQLEFRIRQVGDVEAGMDDHDTLKLTYKTGCWRAFLNEPRGFMLGRLNLIFGDRFVFWKKGV